MVEVLLTNSTEPCSIECVAWGWAEKGRAVKLMCLSLTHTEPFIIFFRVGVDEWEFRYLFVGIRFVVMCCCSRGQISHTFLLMENAYLIYLLQTPAPFTHIQVSNRNGSILVFGSGGGSSTPASMATNKIKETKNGDKILNSAAGGRENSK
jgi:hypothetical protein